MPTILILAYLLAPGTGCAQEDVLQSADVPVYPGAVEITRTFDQVTGMQTVTYRIGLNYPALELLEYYDVQLNARGWHPCFET